MLVRKGWWTMNCLSLSRRSTRYPSCTWVKSKVHRGVSFGVRKMSFGLRLEIAREIHSFAQRAEFAKAGAGLVDRAESAVIAGEVDKVYLRCGLATIEGLNIDGAAADADSLFQRGPEDLTQEVLQAIKGVWGLSEEQRKN